MDNDKVAAPLAYEENSLDLEKVNGSLDSPISDDDTLSHFITEPKYRRGVSEEPRSNEDDKHPINLQTLQMNDTSYDNCPETSHWEPFSFQDREKPIESSECGLWKDNSNLQVDTGDNPNNSATGSTNTYQHGDVYADTKDNTSCMQLKHSGDNNEGIGQIHVEDAPRAADACLQDARPLCQQTGDDDNTDSTEEYFASEQLYTPGRYRKHFLIGIFLKYSIFIFNFLFWVAAVCGFGYGYWILTSKGQIFTSGIYSVLEPPVMLCTVSFIIFIVAFFGFLGALRENILLLKIFRFSLVLVLLIQTIIGILVFVFYTMPEARASLLAGPESVLKDAIKRYHDDKGSREWIDLIQKEFKCCGISHSREGYKDWQINMYFNCSKSNPSMERCAVPVSCCIFEPGDYVNVMCGYGTTDLPRERVFNRIYTKGCMRGLADWMRGNESYIGGFLLGFVTPQILGVIFSTMYMHHIKRSRTRWRLLERTTT